MSRFLREYELREGLDPIDLSSMLEDLRIRQYRDAYVEAFEKLKKKETP